MVARQVSHATHACQVAMLLASVRHCSLLITIASQATKSERILHRHTHLSQISSSTMDTHDSRLRHDLTKWLEPDLQILCFSCLSRTISAVLAFFALDRWEKSTPSHLISSYLVLFSYVPTFPIEACTYRAHLYSTVARPFVGFPSEE